MEAVRKSKSSRSNNREEFEMNKVLGQIRSFEVKRAKGIQSHWNVHQHAFILAKEDLDQWQISEEWKRFSKDSFIVDVTPITAKNSESDPVESGLLEVIKYPLKFAGLTPEDAWLAHETLKGRRMTDTLGICRGINPGEITHDDGIEEMSGPFKDFIARWNWERESFDLSPELRRFKS